MNGFEPMPTPDLTTYAVMESQVFWRGFIYGCVIAAMVVYSVFRFGGV